jgi:Tol biopolymer transport system component
MSAQPKLIGLLLSAALLASCAPGTKIGQGVTLPESPLLSAFERKSGLIAYVGADGNVYTVDQSGKDPTQLTTDAQLDQSQPVRLYQYPVWSPDGESLAFHGFSGAEGSLHSSVYTVSKDGQNLVEAYSSDANRPIYLSWSPDSKNLSFIASVGNTNNLVLNMVPASGGQTTTLDVGGPYYWDWQPDSAGMFIHSGGSASQNPGGARLSLLTVTDGVAEDGFNLSSAAFQSPEFSADGSQLLLAVEQDDKKKLVLTDRAGAVQSELATFDTAVAFGWSPDGQHIAYITDSGDGKYGITHGKLQFVEAGDTSKTIAVEADNVIAFFWSPDSKQVVYFVLHETTNDSGSPVFYLEMATANPVDGATKSIVPQFIPTREYLQTLAYFDQYARSSTIWSPDSQNILLCVDTNSGAGVFVIPASGGIEPRFLQPGTMAFWSWR